MNSEKVSRKKESRRKSKELDASMSCGRVKTKLMRKKEDVCKKKEESHEKVEDSGKESIIDLHGA